MKQIASQERLLPRMCRVLNFHFDFNIEKDYIAEIEYIQDMNETNVSDEEIFPMRLYVHNSDVWYVFHRSFQDRVYCLTIFDSIDDTIA